MRKNDYTPEYFSLVSLLDLRPGDLFLDCQVEADLLLPIAHSEVTDRGRTIGMAFGAETIGRVQKMLEKHDLDQVEIVAAHPAVAIPFKDELFHAVVLRHDLGVRRLDIAFNEMWRVSKPGARVVARHMEWSVKLPRATEHEERMLQSLRAPGVADGKEFFERFKAAAPRGWRDVRMDVFTIATRDPRANTRYNYDWRTLMRDQLQRQRVYTPRDILSLIERLEDTRGAKVVVDRYLILAIKS